MSMTKLMASIEYRLYRGLHEEGLVEAFQTKSLHLRCRAPKPLNTQTPSSLQPQYQLKVGVDATKTQKQSSEMIGMKTKNNAEVIGQSPIVLGLRTKGGMLQ